MHFDSVSKNIMRIAWTRLGVSQEWADWLVRLDDNDMITVRTLLVAKIWTKKGRKGFTAGGRVRKEVSNRAIEVQ